MKSKLLTMMALAVVLVFAFAAVAQADIPQGTIDDIIQDAADGQIDGVWTEAEIIAALAYLDDNPDLDVDGVRGVLDDYLASLQDAAEAEGGEGGELSYTGAPLLLLLAGGAGLIGGGALLRRRR